jgi:hypothetical protein
MEITDALFSNNLNCCLIIKRDHDTTSVNNIKHTEVCSFILNTFSYGVYSIKPLYIIISVLLMKHVLLLFIVNSTFESLINQNED